MALYSFLQEVKYMKVIWDRLKLCGAIRAYFSIFPSFTDVSIIRESWPFRISHFLLPWQEFPKLSSHLRLKHFHTDCTKLLENTQHQQTGAVGPRWTDAVTGMPVLAKSRCLHLIHHTHSVA
jgi:hypothetical protein